MVGAFYVLAADTIGMFGKDEFDLVEPNSKSRSWNILKVLDQKYYLHVGPIPYWGCVGAPPILLILEWRIINAAQQNHDWRIAVGGTFGILILMVPFVMHIILSKKDNELE